MGMAVGGKGIRNEINVVPLIDVVLVLLVIFMVIIPLSQKGIDIDVPEKSKAQQQKPDKDDEKKKPLVLSIRSDSSIDINSEAVPRSELENKIRELISEKEDKTIFIKAAGSLIYGAIIDVMDVCKGAGVKNIAIMTEKKKQQ